MGIIQQHTSNYQPLTMKLENPRLPIVAFLFLFSIDQVLLSKNLPLIMVFRRKFLYRGRQKKYFHVKILILVCPNRTYKILKIGDQIKIL